MALESEQRNFRGDPMKLKRLRVAAGLTVKEIIELTDLDRTTVSKILRGDAVFLKSLALLGERAFGIDDPMQLLHPEELQAMGAQTEVPSPGQVLEWEIEEYLSGWEKTTNGLQFQVVRLRHKYLDRAARGKCYELRHLTEVERRRVEHYLLRHATVAEQVGEHPHIARNITAAPMEGLWWVLDQWEDGVSLERRLDEGPLGEYTLRIVMTGIAHGLAALHGANVIRRELSPKSVLLRDRDDRAVLTDMELAKLSEGGATVAPEEWPDDPYRALEVSDDAPVDSRADLYGWGRIFMHAATGDLPDRGTEDSSQLDIPQNVRDVVQQCASITRSDRPENIKPVLKALKGWT